MSAKMHRQITRRITLTAAEIYDAVAKKYDLPSVETSAVVFDDMSYSEVTIIAREVNELELTA